MRKLIGLTVILCAGILMAFSNAKNDAPATQQQVLKEEIPGIKFSASTYEDALKLSKKTGKLIFIDCYTNWCGPCKLLARNTFTDAKVGEYFNSNFINLKIEMEKDAEGPELARLFKIRAYPTMLLINHKGEIVGTQMGYVTPDVLLNFAKGVNGK